MAGATRPVADTTPTDNSQDAPARDKGAPASTFEQALQDVTQPRPEPPSAALASEQFQRGAATGQTLARYGSHDLRADERSNQEFGSLDAATAYARSLDAPAAVVEENGHYAVYRIHAERWFFQGDFSRQHAVQAGDSNATNVQSRHDGLRALVTTDDFVIRTDGGAGVLDPVGSALGPFASHVQAFGPGLSQITDRSRFERQFEDAMRDTALAALDSSQRAAQDIRSRLNGNDLTPQDRAALERTLQRLQPLDQQIADKQKEVDDAFWSFAGSSYAVGQGVPSQWAIDAQSKAYDTLKQRQAELAQLKAQRADAARDFPLALKIDNLDAFRRLSPHDQTVALRSAADGVLSDIATTRANIENGKFNLWMMDGVRNATAAGLGIEGERLRWVEERATGERRTDAAWKIGETALTIGLAVGGAFFSGGASLALLGASAALGVHGAIDTTSDYFRDRAAANSDLDPNAGLIPQEAVGSWAFVAAAWIGVGLDAAAVGNAIRALRAGQSLADAAKTLGVGEEALKVTINASKVNGFSTSILGTEAFNARFGSDAADAVTLLRSNGHGGVVAEIVTRGGISSEARAAALQEEFIHLQQLADPALAPQFARLSEDRLARWPQMSSADRMQTARAQLTIEADAQRRILVQKGATATDADRIALANYEKQLGEVETGLHDGRPPAWLANAEPPRLFSTPQWPANNAAAVAKGYPELAEGSGQFYRRSPNGQDYELTRFAPGSEHWVNPDVNPVMRVVRTGDGYELAPAERQLTAAERRAEIEAGFGTRSGNASLESAFDAARLTPYQRAYARQYQRIFAELESRGVSPADVLKGVAGKSEAASGQLIRDSLRSEMVRLINDAPAADRMGLLQRFLDVQPSNGDRGALFSQFRASSAAPGIKTVDLGPNSTTLAGTTRRADGVVEVAGAQPQRGMPPEGFYLAEDKAGPGAFKLDQARRYSDALAQGNGHIAAANGRQYNGIVYFFSNEADAQAASVQLGRARLNPSIHVAYYDREGALQWLR